MTPFPNFALSTAIPPLRHRVPRHVTRTLLRVGGELAETVEALRHKSNKRPTYAVVNVAAVQNFISAAHLLDELLLLTTGRPRDFRVNASNTGARQKRTTYYTYNNARHLQSTAGSRYQPGRPHCLPLTCFLFRGRRAVCNAICVKRSVSIAAASRRRMPRCVPCL